MESAFALDIAFHALMLLIYLVFWGVVFVILYHFTRFGIGVQPKRLAASFFMGSILIFCASIIFFTKLDITSVIQ